MTFVDTVTMRNGKIDGVMIGFLPMKRLKTVTILRMVTICEKRIARSDKLTKIRLIHVGQQKKPSIRQSWLSMRLRDLASLLNLRLMRL